MKLLKSLKAIMFGIKISVFFILTAYISYKTEKILNSYLKKLNLSKFMCNLISLIWLLILIIIAYFMSPV